MLHPAPLLPARAEARAAGVWLHEEVPLFSS
jgi:hypothetical protein